MNRKYIVLVGAAVIPSLTAFAFTPPAVSTVGPEPIARTASAHNGYLQVFSETETRLLGDNTRYYPHTGYSIHLESGQVLRFVPNHVGDMDEVPMLVRVPTGKYNIVAESAAYGRVTVPVVIQEGRTTVVHLDRDRTIPPNADPNDLVRLPNGEIVGWSESAER